MLPVLRARRRHRQCKSWSEVWSVGKTLEQWRQALTWAAESAAKEGTAAARSRLQLRLVEWLPKKRKRGGAGRKLDPAAEPADGAAAGGDEAKDAAAPACEVEVERRVAEPG